MLHWILIILAIYIPIAVAFYIADGWFQTSNGTEEDAVQIAACWPIIIIISPFFLAVCAREYLKVLKKEKLSQEKDKERIRIDAQNEEEVLLKQIELELKESKRF